MVLSNILKNFVFFENIIQIVEPMQLLSELDIDFGGILFSMLSSRMLAEYEKEVRT